MMIDQGMTSRDKDREVDKRSNIREITTQMIKEIEIITIKIKEEGEDMDLETIRITMIEITIKIIKCKKKIKIIHIIQGTNIDLLLIICHYFLFHYIISEGMN